MVPSESIVSSVIPSHCADKTVDYDITLCDGSKWRISQNKKGNYYFGIKLNGISYAFALSRENNVDSLYSPLVVSINFKVWLERYTMLTVEEFQPGLPISEFNTHIQAGPRFRIVEQDTTYARA